MKTAKVVALLSLMFCYTSSARGQMLEWIRQLGTSDRDSSYGVSADGLGSVYISGSTRADGRASADNRNGGNVFPACR